MSEIPVFLLSDVFFFKKNLQSNQFEIMKLPLIAVKGFHLGPRIATLFFFSLKAESCV